MLLKNTLSQSSSNSAEGRWPNCPDVEDVCPIYSMARVLGTDVQSILVSFIGEADEGARLTLQKNQNGFTVQVTSAVKRGSESERTLDLDGLRSLDSKLDRK